MIYYKLLLEVKYKKKCEHPDLNREYIVPHTTVLPIKLYPHRPKHALCWSDSNTQI